MITLLSLCALIVAIARGRVATRARWPFVVVGALLIVVAIVAAPTGLVLQKTLGRAVLPLGLCWLGLLSTATLRLFRDDNAGARKAAVLAAVLTLLGNEPLGQAMIDVLEAPFQADPMSAGSFDAVIVLGGGAQQGPGNVELGPCGDRIFLGARLFHSRQTPLLVTTGTPIEGFQLAYDHPFDSLGATTQLWRDVGVDPAAIVTVTGTRNTSEEAQRAAQLIKARGWKRVGLVTSAWHLRRALRLFARAGADVVPLAADHRGAATWEGLFSVVPTGNGAYLQQKAMWEWIGAAVGR